MFRKNQFVKKSSSEAFRMNGLIRFLPAAAVVALLLVVTGCPPSNPGRDGERGTIPDLKREIFVINTLAETLSIINPGAITDPTGEISADDYTDNGSTVDLTKEKIYNDVLVTGSWPNHVFCYDGKLYVVCSGDNVIDVYDESTFEWLGDIDLGTGSNPWMIVHEEGSSTGYVPNFVAGDVAVVNLDNYRVLDRIETGPSPEGAAVVNGYLFVCNTNLDAGTVSYGEGTVTVIDTADNSFEKTIDIEDSYTEGKGANPQSAIAFPGLDEVHIVCTGTNGGDDADDGEVVILDSDPGSGTFLQVKQRLAIGGSPVGGEGAVDENRNLVYLTGVGGLLSYDYGTGSGDAAVVRGSDNPIIAGDGSGGDFYSGSLYDPVEDLIFVTFFTDDRILALDADVGDPGNDTYPVSAEMTGSDGPGSPVLFVE